MNDSIVTSATAATELVSEDVLDVATPREVDEVVVLDYGGQYSQLIARRVRELGVFSELLPHHVGAEEVRRRKPKGLILSGGPASVYAAGAPRLDRELLELGIPVLGICYGMQLIATELGGTVEGAEIGEFGRSELTVREPGRLFAGLPQQQTCWMSHRDTVFAPPPGFTALASSTASPVAALENVERGIYGIQFHPEVVHTPYGQTILERFLGEICAADRTWSPESIVSEQIARIRAQVGTGKVICGLSGGVDSSVAALLVHRAIGDQLTCVFVDHGLMRKNEGEQVIAAFRDHFKVPLVAVEAEQRFLARLAGVSDPETKRKAIGAEFIRVFEEEAAKLGDAKFLVQGTLYSDVIESGGGTGAATIKSHHNVGGLPDDLAFGLVEPLRHAELGADGADLVLEQRAQRLDELELQVVRQAADVVVGLDRRRPRTAAGLDDVGVERPLDQELHLFPVGAGLGDDLARRGLEHPDELAADRLALGLRVGDAGERTHEPVHLVGHVQLHTG